MNRIHKVPAFGGIILSRKYVAEFMNQST